MSTTPPGDDMDWARFDDGTLMTDPPLPPVDDSPPGPPEETRGPPPPTDG